MNNETKLKDFFTTISDDNYEKLVPSLYDTNIEFQDPMNACQDREHYLRIIKDLFKQLKDIHFEIHESLGKGHLVSLEWTMKYKFRGKSRAISGTTFAKFNEEGLITHQRDYWDASMGVYDEFPMMGAGIKLIRKMLRVS